ncbi:MAG: LuxR C-terminal-related transcriptional regulator [Gaiellales bacterium]
MSAARTAILLDPHPLWLDAVERVLESVGVDVSGKATQLDLALELISEHNPDLFVAELVASRSRLEAAETIRLARERAPGVRVIALSSVSDPEHIDHALSAGAVAYVIKTAQSEDLASAVRYAFERSVFFPSRQSAFEGGTPARASEEAGSLTRRELEILRLVAKGHTNAQLARLLWVTEQTVKFHLSNIYRKLNVANRTEASRWAQLHGLLPFERATS